MGGSRTPSVCRSEAEPEHDHPAAHASSLMAEIERAARARGEMGGPPDCMLSLQGSDDGGAAAPALYPAHSQVRAL